MAAMQAPFAVADERGDDFVCSLEEDAVGFCSPPGVETFPPGGGATDAQAIGSTHPTTHDVRAMRQ